MFVAFAGSQLVGMIDFMTGSCSRVRHVGEMGLSVQKTYWGLGIGIALIETLKEKNGIVRKINLRVRTDNVRAIALYKKSGFIDEGRLSRNSLIDGKFYDSFALGLEID